MRVGLNIRALVVVLLAGALFAGCGDEAPAPTIESQAVGELSANSEIPRPTSKPVLTVTGAISKSNAAEGLRLDLETLEQMPISEATVYEPFLKQKVSFSGVMMDDLVRIVGAEGSSILMTALDDYQVELKMSELTSSTVMLATREEGKAIKIRAGGPIRIIFLTDEGSGSNRDAWIWSVVRMRVQR